MPGAARVSLCPTTACGGLVDFSQVERVPLVLSTVLDRVTQSDCQHHSCFQACQLHPLLGTLRSPCPLKHLTRLKLQT